VWVIATSPAPAGAPGAESLGLPGSFRIATKRKAVSEGDRAEILSTLRSRESWVTTLVPCIFEPEIALAVPDRRQLLLLVSFKSDEVAAVRSMELLGKWSLAKEARQRLFAICEKYQHGLSEAGGCSSAPR